MKKLPKDFLGTIYETPDNFEFTMSAAQLREILEQQMERVRMVIEQEKSRRIDELGLKNMVTKDKWGTSDIYNFKSETLDKILEELSY
jgi:hypothetical protein